MTPGDIVMAIGIVGFVVALVPGVLENWRLRRGWTLWSCALTAAMAYVVTIGLVLLGAMLSAVLELTIAALWTILAVQSWRWRPSAKSHEGHTVSFGPASGTNYCHTCGAFLK